MPDASGSWDLDLVGRRDGYGSKLAVLAVDVLLLESIYTLIRRTYRLHPSYSLSQSLNDHGGRSRARRTGGKECSAPDYRGRWNSARRVAWCKEVYARANLRYNSEESSLLITETFRLRPQAVSVFILALKATLRRVRESGRLRLAVSFYNLVWPVFSISFARWTLRSMDLGAKVY
ncbi:hypothetical protein BDN71DRAFT_1437047 [Pleurotus eryngii]|uniref:Uncharacterized protein n=1 Tax=Pleurotus eryngii TaxID=5323 RepID=A0A9P6D901_PLEER|nr:hypothetical protein BDN71DRAFT_1437047 [Pleurotus eryngii]